MFFYLTFKKTIILTLKPFDHLKYIRFPVAFQTRLSVLYVGLLFRVSVASYKSVDHMQRSWGGSFAEIHFNAKCKLKVISWQGNQFASYEMPYSKKSVQHSNYLISSALNILPWQELIECLLFLLPKVPSYKPHLNRQKNCCSLRCSLSIALCYNTANILE